MIWKADFGNVKFLQSIRRQRFDVDHFGTIHKSALVHDLNDSE